VHLHVHLHAITATPTREARMILDIAIIAVGVLVFVVPELVPKLVAVLRRTRRPPAEERRLLDGERQRLVRERRRLAAERAELAGTHTAGCPWCGFPIPPPR
jgi:hypothetical protein